MYGIVTGLQARVNLVLQAPELGEVAVGRFLEKTIPAARWLSEAEASSKRSQLMSLQVDFFKGIALNV
jgi:hypothetical protein